MVDVAPYEFPDQPEVTPEADRDRPRPTASSSVAEAVEMGLVTLLLIGWTAGAFGGIVYWAMQGSLGGVILSAVVPGLGAMSTLPLLRWPGTQ